MLKYFVLILIVFFGGIDGYSQQFFMKWQNPVNLVTLNTKYSEFGAEYNAFDSLLYFNSDRKSGHSYFYTSKIIDLNSFTIPEFVKGEINQSDDNVSYICFSKEDRAYLSSFRMNGRPYFNIFETIRTRDGWSAPIPVPEFSKSYNILQPTLSANGKMLVFISDMKSADKKTDLFISYKNELGVWSEPEFMSILNTDDMEITPKFHTDDTLFFASDGLSGPGGYDLYYSTRKIDGTWTKPNPLNDINTSFDESDIVILPNYFAVFASNRPGGKGGSDLFLTNYYWSENKIPPERLLDISIATQTVNIKTISDFTYELSCLPNVILSDISDEALKRMLTKADSAFEFTGNIDSDYQASVNEIGVRISNNKGARLLINYNILESVDKNIKLPNSLAIAGQVRDYFINSWNVDPSNIELIKHFQKVTGSELQSFPIIYFDSDNPSIFKPNQTGHRKVSTDPPFSDIFINIKPIATFSSFVTNVNFGSNTNIFTKYSNVPSEQFTIPLNDYARELSKTDSIQITVKAVNKFNDTITKTLQFDITHSESKKRKRFIIDDTQFEQLYVFIPELENENIPVFLSEVVDLIAESAVFSKSVKLQFFSLLAQQKAVNFYNILKKKINLPYLKIDLAQVPYENNDLFTRRFTPFIVRVLFEKP